MTKTITKHQFNSATVLILDESSKEGTEEDENEEEGEEGEEEEGEEGAEGEDADDTASQDSQEGVGIIYIYSLVREFQKTAK